MKFAWTTFLALSLLVGILCNAESTEETPTSTDSETSEPPTEGDQPAESTENSDSSSPSEGEDGQQSKEPTEDESAKPDDNSEESTGKPSKSEKEPAGKEKAPSAEGSYSATYQEIGKILDSVDFKSIEDLHLQRMLENEYQARVRNPIVDQTGQIADFSAIKSCFGKLAGEVKKLINAAKKQFKTCKTGGGTSSGCTDEQQNPFADGVINLATTLQGCISSKRKN